MLGCLSMGLLVYLKNEQSQQLCQLMRSLELAQDYVLLIHQLLRGAHALLLRATNIRTGCRLALLSRDFSKSLIFEPDRKTNPDLDGGASTVGKGPAPLDPQIHVSCPPPSPARVLLYHWVAGHG